jgi:hypothetical protein
MATKHHEEESIEVQINGNPHLLINPLITGADLLALENATPEKYRLSRVTEDQGVPDQEVEPEETLDVREHYNRFFNTISKERWYSFGIDEKSFESTRRLITGRELLRLVDLDPAGYDIGFRIVGAPDTYVLPDQEADLGLPGREQFYTLVKKPLRISIDGTSYTPGKTEMTGAELRSLPSPPIGDDREFWWDVPGKEDQQVAPTQRLVLEDGMAFYTKAGARFFATVVINGVGIDVPTTRDSLLRTIALDALQKTGNDTGRPIDEWELKDKDGTLLDMSLTIEHYGFESGVKLYLAPKVGAGGCCGR